MSNVLWRSAVPNAVFQNFLTECIDLNIKLKTSLFHFKVDIFLSLQIMNKMTIFSCNCLQNFQI
jgi:hypothetical protein